MATLSVFRPQEALLVPVNRRLPPPAPKSHHGEISGHSAGFTEQADPLAMAVKLVLDAVTSPNTKRMYAHSLVVFTEFKRKHAYAFTRATVYAWRADLEAKGLSPATINQYLAAVRKLAAEAAANGLLDAETAAAIKQVAGVRESGNRIGNWLSRSQAQALIEAPAPNTLKGKRDRAALALLVGCALRRSEAQALTFEHIQQREGRWVIVDLRGKGNRIRSVAMPSWVKVAIDRWAEAAQISTGCVLRAMNRYGKITADELSGWGIWFMAAGYSESLGIEFKPHDLRRTCAKLCRSAGGELEQIQMLLGHASVQTTERYLGTKQDLTNAPNDRLGLKWRDE